eukprot:TRINITY_DN81358_c0_g1_i2.p1 TRINITY_DN81358_c0_g1~~TRINITY_DN81358_c0_g1_i2.p1  ORF type:complete len:469 (-),score=96.06 TRINITY_DN81358_c0_g1_i2:185-1591(-)
MRELAGMRPPRPRSRGAMTAAAVAALAGGRPGGYGHGQAAAPPPFMAKPPKPPQRARSEDVAAANALAAATAAAKARAPSPCQRFEDFRSLGAAMAPMPQPVLSNVATFARPKAYSAALQSIPALPTRRIGGSSSSATASTRSYASGGGSSSSSTSTRRGGCQRSPIDMAIQRELIGDGIALDEVVESKRTSGWAVKQRHVQKSDVGHCCHGCKQPLRDLNEEVTVWTGAAIYRRFHPSCAASYVLKVDNGENVGAAGENVVEGYADGWRALRDGDGTSGQRHSLAARQWLLSQDPSAWPALRGDVFTTVTVIEDGKKKAVPGLSHEQLRLLTTKHRWQGPSEPAAASQDDARQPTREIRGDCAAGSDRDQGGEAADAPEATGGEGELCQPCEDAQAECSICFGEMDRNGPLCVQLPCAPQHIFHMACVRPWLQKASLCPTCRKDLRSLLPASAKGSAKAGSSSAVSP